MAKLLQCVQILPCFKRYCHDWTICPFAHPGKLRSSTPDLSPPLLLENAVSLVVMMLFVSSGEKARRRDPRTVKYSGIACPEMKKVW